MWRVRDTSLTVEKQLLHNITGSVHVRAWVCVVVGAQARKRLHERARV